MISGWVVKGWVFVTMVWHIDNLRTVFRVLSCYFMGIQFEIQIFVHDFLETPSIGDNPCICRSYYAFGGS